MEKVINVNVNESYIKRRAALELYDLKNPVFYGDTIEYINRELEYINGKLDMLTFLGIIKADDADDLQKEINKEYHDRKKNILKNN